MKGPAGQIDDLEEEELEDLATGKECTLAAETSVQVLSSFIRLLELTAMRDFDAAEKEARTTARTSRQVNRSARLCAEGLDIPTEDESEETLV